MAQRRPLAAQDGGEEPSLGERDRDDGNGNDRDEADAEPDAHHSSAEHDESQRDDACAGDEM